MKSLVFGVSLLLLLLQSCAQTCITQNKYSQLELQLADTVRVDFPQFSYFVPVDQLPSIAFRPSPVFPCEFRRAGAEGKVLMKLLLSEDGTPLHYIVVSSAHLAARHRG